MEWVDVLNLVAFWINKKIYTGRFVIKIAIPFFGTRNPIHGQLFDCYPMRGS
jgi:hypothetical protein